MMGLTSRIRRWLIAVDAARFLLRLLLRRLSAPQRPAPCTYAIQTIQVPRPEPHPVVPEIQSNVSRINNRN